MSKPHELYEPGPAIEAKARILVAHLEGALDAGSAGGLAVHQLLRTLNPERVATFESDQLLDYRSHRPIMEVENWVTTGLRVPQVAMDLVHDDQGQPILILHGQEPDSKWHAFTDAVVGIAEAAGVEAVVALHGLPAAVPHTRPTAVHVQSTDADLIPDQPQMGGVAQFPAPYTSFLQHKFSERGRTGLTLLATVPYYMANATFPSASSALIRRLADMAELSLPVGDLERGADEEASQVNQLVEQSRDLRGTVSALERHFDSIVHGGEDGSESQEEGLPEEIDSARVWEEVMRSEAAENAIPEAERVQDSTDSLADTIGDAIEKYLKTYAKHKASEESPATGNGPEVPFGRHRAPENWEVHIERDFPDDETDQPEFGE